MAKVATIKIELPADFTVSSHGHTITAEALRDAPAAVPYLIENGFRSSINDAAAMSRKAKDAAGAGLAALVSDRRSKRFAAIMAGEVGSGEQGARATPVERVMAVIAKERLKALAVKVGRKMPKKDGLKTALSLILAQQGDSIRAEAETRIVSASLHTEELAGLFAEPEGA